MHDTNSGAYQAAISQPHISQSQEHAGKSLNDVFNVVNEVGNPFGGNVTGKGLSGPGEINLIDAASCSILLKNVLVNDPSQAFKGMQVSTFGIDSKLTAGNFNQLNAGIISKSQGQDH